MTFFIGRDLFFLDTLQEFKSDLNNQAKFIFRLYQSVECGSRDFKQMYAKRRRSAGNNLALFLKDPSE